MAEQIQIKQNLMNTTAADLKKAADEVKQVKSNIKVSTDNLLSSWVGTSKSAFHDEYTVLNMNLGEYSEILLDMAKMIEDISNKFSDQDILLSNAMVGE